MFIKVKIKPGSKKILIHQKSSDKFEISVRARPENNAANDELLDLLSEFLGVDEKRLKIVKGWKERNKIIEII